MKLYGAVDLHSNNSYAAISDEKDQVTFPNSVDVL